jgi:hypothetical protein
MCSEFEELALGNSHGRQLAVGDSRGKFVIEEVGL